MQLLISMVKWSPGKLHQNSPSPPIRLPPPDTHHHSLAPNNLAVLWVFCHSLGTVALTWLSGLCVPVTPRAMPVGVFTPLVGSPKPERSRRRVQTKESPRTLQMWRLGLRLTTSSCKKVLVTERATKTTNYLYADLPRSSSRMTASCESRKETTGMKLDVMSAKTKTRIAFWNVRTMYETGKLAQVTAEMRRYNLHVLGVSESRWIGTGR